MSGVAKTVGKVFKSVAKAAVKVVPAVLAVGTTVFTAGAALGLAPMATGWGGAVASAVSATGATGTLGTVLTGAVTQAGYGAVLGAGASLLTGGDIGKGAAIGALGGAVTGGLTSGLSSGLTSSASTHMGTANATQAAAQPAVSAASKIAQPAVTTGANMVPQSGFTSFLSNNKGMVGKVVAGAAQGYMAGKAKEAEMDLYREKMAQEQKQIDDVRDSYKIGPSYRETPRWYHEKPTYDHATGRIG